jgi:hypothetical protein
METGNPRFDAGAKTLRDLADEARTLLKCVLREQIATAIEELEKL